MDRRRVALTSTVSTSMSATTSRPSAPTATGTAAGADDLREGLLAAARAAREGAASTEAIAARRGRASYAGDVARGVLDPGAVTVALFFESAPIGETS